MTEQILNSRHLQQNIDFASAPHLAPFAPPAGPPQISCPCKKYQTTAFDEPHILAGFELMAGYSLWEDPLEGEDVIAGAATRLSAQNYQTPMTWMFDELFDLVVRMDQWIIHCGQVEKRLALYEMK